MLLRLLGLFSVAVVVTTVPPFARPADDRASVTAFLDAYARAVEDGDPARAEALFARDARVVEHGVDGGALAADAEQRLTLRPGDVRLAGLLDREADIRIEGETAVVEGTHACRLFPQGRPEPTDSPGRWLMILLKADGDWRITHLYTTPGCRDAAE